MAAINDILAASHSYRNYEPEMFETAWENADGRREEARVRKSLRRVEDGRFRDMLKTTHKMFAALDKDERETFYARNPRLMRWVNVYADVEELIDFRDFSP